MDDQQSIFDALSRHAVPFTIIGGHAVNFHGFVRATEDVDVMWLRSRASEMALLAALTEIEARYLGKEIDPDTRLEKAYPVTAAYISASPLMMLWTRHGFLDLFDYVPGLPDVDVSRVVSESVTSGQLRYVSLSMLRDMKRTTGRPKDLLDLEQLPE